MAEFVKFPRDDSATPETLIEGLEHMIRLVRTGRIDACVVIAPSGDDEGGAFTMIPPTNKTDIVRLLGALEIAKARLLDRIEI